MSIQLHKNCIKQIIENLSESLGNIKINHRQYVEYSSTNTMNNLDYSLPESGHTKVELDRIFGDDERLPEFSIDWITRQLRASQKYELDQQGELLSSLESFRDQAAIAERIVTDFSNLPNRYVISLPLPEAIGKPLEPAASDRLTDTPSPRLCIMDEGFSTTFPVNIGESGPSLLGLLNRRLPLGKTCLQVDAEGFIDLYGTTLTAANAIGHIRSFFGLGLANHIFSVGNPKISMGFGPIRMNVYVHRLHQEAFHFDADIDLDDDLSALIDRMEPIPSGIIDEESRKKYLDWGFNRIRQIFGMGERGDRVRRAARWLFDSYAGSNQLLSFVQAMVSLEILLGDKESSDLTGLTELLRNRCAYLLGSSHTERQEILGKFREIYKVRSQIVHSGKSHLSGKDRRLFYELRDLCRKVLSKEMDLLLATPQDEVARALAGKGQKN